MQRIFAVVAASLVFLVLPETLFAKEIHEYRGEADQYYADQNFSKAFKVYKKAAKMGDHHSQGQLARMYARGEGKRADMEEAYAWSTLAAEGGDEALKQQSKDLLAQVDDVELAEKRAAKLMKRYGAEALEEKARKRATRLKNNERGGCTGSRMGCSGG